MTNKKNEEKSYISLFCGCGGLDLGFAANGYKCLAAFDQDLVAVENFNKNIGNHAVKCDLSLEDPTTRYKKSVDVVLAGSPCQGFSTAGKRVLNDPRNSLLLRAGEIAMNLRPKVFVVENVPGVIIGKHKRYWDSLIQSLKINGYSVGSCKVKVNDFGVPQIRKRIILIAWKNGVGFDLKLESTLKDVVLKDAIKSINGSLNHHPVFLDPDSQMGKIARNIKPGQKLCNVRGGERAIPTWKLPEVFGVCSKEEIEILEVLRNLRRKIRVRDYGDADPVSLMDIEEHVGQPVAKQIETLIGKGYMREKEGKFDLTQTFNGLFRRLSWDEPSLTVDTRFGSPRYFLHPDEDRGFTVREAARVQGFPDSFEFVGNEKEQYRMIGNAVPPPLAKCIGSFVRKTILR